LVNRRNNPLRELGLDFTACPTVEFLEMLRRVQSISVQKMSLWFNTNHMLSESESQLVQAFFDKVGDLDELEIALVSSHNLVAVQDDKRTMIGSILCGLQSRKERVKKVFFHDNFDRGMLVSEEVLRNAIQLVDEDMQETFHVSFDMKRQPEKKIDLAIVLQARNVKLDFQRLMAKYELLEISLVEKLLCNNAPLTALHLLPTTDNDCVDLIASVAHHRPLRLVHLTISHRVPYELFVCPKALLSVAAMISHPSSPLKSLALAFVLDIEEGNDESIAWFAAALRQSTAIKRLHLHVSCIHTADPGKRREKALFMGALQGNFEIEDLEVNFGGFQYSLEVMKHLRCRNKHWKKLKELFQDNNKIVIGKLWPTILAKLSEDNQYDLIFRACKEHVLLVARTPCCVE